MSWYDRVKTASPVPKLLPTEKCGHCGDKFTAPGYFFSFHPDTAEELEHQGLDIEPCSLHDGGTFCSRECAAQDFVASLGGRVDKALQCDGCGRSAHENYMQNPNTPVLCQHCDPSECEGPA